MEIIVDPKMIEAKSMAIIEESIPSLAGIPEGERGVIKRIIHTTGDLAIAENIKISSGAVAAGIAAIREGKSIMTDVNMLRVGINSSKLNQFAISCFCLINDPEVIEEAKGKKITRAMAAIGRGANWADGGIIAIGNAPTALFALCKMIGEGKAKPALVVGTPVGFVGAAESKALLINTGIEYITITGNRGGSNIAASVINALLLQA